VLVVIAYQSLFGTTCAIAEAIAEGVCQGRHSPEIRCLPAVGVAPELAAHADLLVVGAPTHYRGLPSRNSVIAGRQAQRRAALLGSTRAGSLGLSIAPAAALLTPGQDDDDVDLRAWLRDLPRARSGVGGAGFDTRLTSRWAGGASSDIVRRLHKRGYPLVVPPEGFTIETASGPPRAGELERALRWGRSLRRVL
jgi:hypothetical protein